MLAMFLGLAIAETGITIWSVNAHFLQVPLAAVLTAGILFVYFNYFSGRWFTVGNAFRRLNFRSFRLSPSTWKWSLLAAALIVIVLESGLALLFRFIPFPEKAFKAEYRFFDSMPAGNAWIIIFMSSLVAGICEETGFRGYMQASIERQLGALPAILLSSAVFVLLHLTKSWAITIFPLIFLISFLLGCLAWRAGSILPGIIAHAVFDIFNFSYWWSDVAGNYRQPTILQAGIDGQFICMFLAFAGSLLSFFLALYKIKKAPN
jgi:membrane protease YdiL (CAAX protease family)